MGAGDGEGVVKTGHQLIRRYAGALFSVAKDRGEEADVDNDMELIDHLYRSSPEFRDLCSSGGLGKRKQREALEELIFPHVTDLTRRCVETMIDHARLSALGLLPEAYGDAHNREVGIVRGELEMVSPPDEHLKDRFREILAARTGRKPEISYRNNPAIRGGFRLSWEDRQIDMSVSRRIAALRATLTDKGLQTR